MKRIVGSVAIILLLISIVGCKFFETSWGAPVKRDNLAELLAKKDTEEIAAQASNPEYKADPEASKALLKALAGKDPEEITALSNEDKQAIMDLGFGIALPLSKIQPIIEKAVNDEENEDSPQSAQDIFDAIMDGVPEFDTTTLQTLLRDENTLKETKASSLVSAAVALATQIMKREDIDIAKLKTYIQTGTMLNPKYEESNDDIAAIKALYDEFKTAGLGSRAGEEINFFGMTIEQLFGVL